MVDVVGVNQLQGERGYEKSGQRGEGEHGVACACASRTCAVGLEEGEGRKGAQLAMRRIEQTGGGCQMAS